VIIPRNFTWNREYGFFPLIYDENQESYVTPLENPITLWSVMKNAQEPSMSSAALESIASEAYGKTAPALFENNMKYRYPATMQVGRLRENV
jgi:hypothetical protein